MDRNYYGPEPTTTDSVRIAEDKAEKVVGEIRHRIGSGAQELESIVENAERSVHERAREMEKRAQERARYAMAILQGQGDDEGDEGWMSDASDDHRREVKKPTRKSNRKKLSIRRHLSSRRAPQRSASIDQAGLNTVHRQEAERREEGSDSPREERGRRSQEPEGARTPASSVRFPHLPRHLRVDSIRTDVHSREQSPSRSVRSVRFVDQRSPSGYNTPRIFSPSSPATSQPGSEVPSEDEGEPAHNGNGHHAEDSPRNVRFSLPDIRR